MTCVHWQKPLLSSEHNTHLFKSTFYQQHFNYFVCSLASQTLCEKCLVFEILQYFGQQTYKQMGAGNEVYNSEMPYMTHR